MPEASKQDEQRASVGRKTVLIVEDSPVDRVILKRFMRLFGYDSFEARDGQQGLDFLKQAESVDLMLVNGEMAGLNGIEFVRRVREGKAFPAVPIIMVTRQDRVEDVLEAIKAGADECILKPITPEMIESKLQLVQRHSAWVGRIQPA